MKKRGRPSGEDLNVIRFAPAQRLAAPAELTEEQSETWRSVIACRPTDWLSPASAPILVAYCRHVAAASHIARMLGNLDHSEAGEDPIFVKRYEQLLRMQTRETSAIARLATKLRLSPHSQYGPRKAATEARDGGNGGPRPWERS